jgi:hypothetical protein
MLERYLLETPWPAMGVLVVLGFVVAYVMWHRKPKVAMASVVGGVLLAGGVYLLAHSVVTTREALQARTQTLINAILAGDEAAAEPLLRDDLTVTLLGSPTNLGKPAVLEQIKGDVAGRYGATNSRIASVRAAMDGNTSARTQADIRVESRITSGTLPTVWMFHWQQSTIDGEQIWRVRQLEAQQIGLMPQGSVRGF